MSARVTVVIATRNRREELMRTVRRLGELAPASPVVVVDNGSDDGTAQAARDGFPGVQVLALPRNIGASARNLGVQAARMPYVAFSDDDSWWAPGALERAAAVLDRHPQLGLVAARTLVGPEQRADPLTTLLAESPLPRAVDAPGPSVLGFQACSAVLRRDAFLQVGGFNPVLFHVGEETLVAYDLAAAGWQLCYLEDVLAHHHPSASRPDPRRRRSAELRNVVLTAWMRRPLRVAAHTAGALARESVRDPAARAALVGVLARLPAALRHRAALPPGVESQVRLLEDGARRRSRRTFGLPW
jgi:GT2 family glycosyltransferase